MALNYPVWDPGFAHGLLIAIVAILHVYVSHFAIGGGLFLVVTETLARRRDDHELLEYLHRHARFFILLTLVFGALSGVGIWFTISLINPAGTSALIHAFVWGWAIEWVFFFVEIVAALIYYYGWKRMSPRDHLTVGWIYFGAAWASMIVINGIISFQMTPGRWLETHGFWDGFFNPSYWPSLATRSFFAVAIAGFFCLWTAARLDRGRLRYWLVRYSGRWAGIGLGLAIVAGIWWMASIPEEMHRLLDGSMPIAEAAWCWMNWMGAGLILLLVFFTVFAPRTLNHVTAGLILLAGLVVMGAGEWARESVRKPYVIHGYLYSNGILADEVDEIRDGGYLAHARWADTSHSEDPAVMGEEIFRVACGNCHARRGYLGLAQRVRGWDEEYTTAFVQRLEYTLRPMPPWVGTEEEAEALAIYLLALPGAESTVSGPVDGEHIYERRCSACHSLHGERALSELVEGLTAEDLDEYLQDLESDEMPPFTGSDEARAALAGFLEVVGNPEEGGPQ